MMKDISKLIDQHDKLELQCTESQLELRELKALRVIELQILHNAKVVDSDPFCVDFSDEDTNSVGKKLIKSYMGDDRMKEIGDNV